MPNLSLKQMGAELGLKKSTVSEHKAAGMPMTSGDDARAWLAKHSRVRKVDLRAGGSAGAQARERKLAEADAVAAPSLDAAQDLFPDVRGPRATDATPDFDEAMLKADERLLIAARKQVEEFLRAGDRIGFADALGSYSKLAKELHATRLRWLSSKARAAELVDIDEVRAAITPHVAEVRRAFVKLGDRLAAKVNPGNPAHAKAVIDEEVESIFRNFHGAERDLARAYTPKDGGEE